MAKLPGLLLMMLCALASAGAADLPHFDEAAIRATVRTLSSDAFSGRAPAGAGEQATIEYLASQFKRFGLQPANAGSFLQAVPLVQISTDPHTALRVRGAAAPLDFAYGSDFIATTPRPATEVKLAASPLVFAGYGIVAPEYHWNDYAGLDVSGKTVVVLVNDPGYASGDPALFNGRDMTYYGRWTYKFAEATRQGAAGVLIVHETGAAGYPWEVVRNSWSGPGDHLPAGDAYQLQVEGWLSQAAAARLMSAAGRSLDELAKAAAQPGFKPVALGLEASLTLHNMVRSIVSHNVVAVVRGTQQPRQAVVYSAHWDHFGVQPGADGRTQIFHGAVDNATGVAGLLELARRFAADRPRPARSVLFIATTAEEQGLLGAAYYVAHPLFPLADTVADLNLDVMDVYGATRDLSVRGDFMSGLDDELRESAGTLGLALLPDADRAKGYYFRADHFEFAKAGVPALSIYMGTDYVGHPQGWGLAQQQAYTQQRYHKPADVYEPDWNLAGMQQQLQALYLTGRTLADSSAWPAWHADSPFKSVRERQRSAAH